MKAKYITSVNDKYGKYVDMMYEYKGHEYLVRKYFNGNAMGEEVWRQHQEEQRRIDNMVENPESHYEQVKGKDLNEELDKIWELMEWD